MVRTRYSTEGGEDGELPSERAHAAAAACAVGLCVVSFLCKEVRPGTTRRDAPRPSARQTQRGGAGGGESPAGQAGT